MVSAVAEQFQVWRLKPRQARRRSQPDFVLILQSRRYDGLPTTIAAPLFASGTIAGNHRLRPEIAIDGRKSIVAFDQLAVLARKDLDAFVADAADNERAFKAALDELLF